MEEKLRQKKSNCIKVVLFGPESTGKTTLAKQLALHYNSFWVPEFSRAYAEEKLKEDILLSKEDVLPITIGQMELENSFSDKAKGILFYDTNLLETKVYSEFIYDGYCPDILKKSVTNNHYNLYLLTYIDIPWEYDSVRSLDSDRKKMFDHFKNELDEHKLPYIILSGNKESRLNKAIQQIDLLLKNIIDV
jgi:NadR type nicotinamide-nucleotide adenylyltransferase